MLKIRSAKCPWASVGAAGALVMLVTAVHVFMVPILPSSLDFSGARRTVDHRPRNVLPGAGVVDSRLRGRFPADSYEAVTFRAAPWKAEIGRWLAGCHAESSAVNITEAIGTKRCQKDCSGNGVCNYDLGECRCFHGYAGKGCERVLKLECNLPSSPEWPVGPWIVSICPAQCDTTRTMCFCGPGTKYPDRPVAEACGFKTIVPAKPDDPKLTDWTTPDPDVFTTNSSKLGWCNVDPEDAYSSKVKFKEECHCKYDGLWGQFCETHVECICINQCSGHGHCRGGFCQCDSGYFGIDCSIPSAYSVAYEWPSWLQAPVNLPDLKNLSNIPINVNAVVEKKRPLIYVYDLPAEFDSHLLEGRHYKLECVNRIYDEKNRTIWTRQLYGAQMALYESILASPHRTLNGDEADYFYVPVLDSCLITRSDDAPHLQMPEDLRLRSYHTLEYYRKAYDHIAQRYPYWNRTSGRDHIWFFSWDEGACYAPKEIWNSMMLVHWGNTNTKHEKSTTAYWADNWDDIPLDRRGNHPCFDPRKDLVLPAWKEPNPGAIWLKLWARPRINRTTLFYFNGNLGPAYEEGRREDTYSMGIRQKLAAEFGSTPNKQGKLGRQHTANVTVTYLKSEMYYEELASSIFCGVLPGDGWSGRMEDSMLQGCIPVIIQDGIFLPYENVLNYNSFAVRIQEDDIPNLIGVLQGMNETQIDFMLGNVRQIWQRFFYRDTMLLEAERQKKLFTEEEAAWSVEVSKLEEGDDVFATFIQVLHYKLYNDPWRQGLLQEKETGLPSICSKAS
ncbi:hypothetical protein CFC21_062940 [Triticum aestivum]|uniref:EGF-like domain-containing protein n=6 Tax=Triticinae TaxID=1648030 RepID=A0A453IWD3_AEGTS|nr:uncharacterized protein LOC109764713 [Aegilops tauschii subsp. strangulata]XP_044376581.1 uncharacterized protein LOC123098612 [Triticum aestivum]KAF7055411.1 hypothetical protein CFC21_062940 [Triticum aestivum]